jgi:hypothetical protein
MAYLLSVPYGFLITFTGDKLIPVLVVWPVKNGGSLSLTSILISSISSFTFFLAFLLTTPI